MCDSSINALSTITCLEVALVPPGPRLSTWAVDKRGYKKKQTDR